MKEISILHSGGPDSTLAALYALELADRVHLLTFHSYVMGKIGKHKKVVDELRRIYGDERIISHEEEIDKIFNLFYFGRMSKHVWKYRTFYVPWICGACKMAMHTKAIAYNLAHGIDTTFDGAHMESASYFPDQADPYMKAMEELYSSYEMTYASPIYNEAGTDKATEKYGMLTTKDTKREHVFFSTQHTCFVGLMVHAHARLYYLPFRGKDRAKILAGRFLRQRIDDCRDHLPRGRQ